MYDSFVQIIAGALSVETLISVIVSIITSLIAALIFYYVVEYRPARRRQKELTPILMNYYRWIHFYLVIFFRDIFKMNLFSSVPDIQKRIIAGEIGTDEWCVALYNKCLNDTYLYGDFSRELVVIGPSLSVTSEKIKNILSL